MTAGVTTPTPSRPATSFLSTNIPFLDRNYQDAFSTNFQEDYKPLPIRKSSPLHPHTPAQVVNKDLRYYKEQLTETKESYPRHPLPKMSRTPRWRLLYTNFKMQTDHRDLGFLTTQSENFYPKPFQHPPALTRPLKSIKSQRVEKLPESTTKSTFTPHHGCSVAKAKVKHLEIFPTIKGDKRHCNFVSQYDNTFQGAWNKAAQPVDKHCSSVVMGDPVKIVDRETNHGASFGPPVVCRYKPPVVKDYLKLSHGKSTSWSSTSKEAFCPHKSDPVVLAKGNPNFSSLPKWDTDAEHSKEMMSETTNRVSFSEPDHTEHPVHAPGASLLTKSNVQFSSPHLSSLYYTSTAQEHFNKKDGERVKPIVHLPSNILSGPDEGLRLSTTRSDFLPLRNCKKTPCLTRQRSSIKFPLFGQHFSTTHNDHYRARRLMPQHPSQILSSN